MKNQFFYKRKVEVKPEKVTTDTHEGGVDPYFKDVEDSFNPNKVIRSFVLDNGTRLVALDDFHEETRPVPIKNKKNEITGWKNQTNVFSSEIILNQEDSERFKQLFEL